MTLRIDYLKTHPQVIDDLATIWQEVLGKIWCPDFSLKQVHLQLESHLHSDCLPLCKVAFDKNKPVGMGCLRINEGVREDLTPWLGGLVVTKSYQGKGIGNMLIDNVKGDAKRLGFSSIFLLTFDPTLPNYYQQLGWSTYMFNV